MPRLTPEQYEAAWRARIAPPDFGKLAEVMARPENELYPLLAFRGSQSVAQLKRKWHFVNAMMLSDVGDFGDAMKLQHIAETGHTCGFHSVIQPMSLYGFFSRLRGSPEVTNLVPHLTEYVCDLHPHDCVLIRVPVMAPTRHRAAWWRTLPPKKQRARVYREPLMYPFVNHGKCDHEHSHDDGTSLVMRVHNAVPHSIPSEIRGDLCQDLVVAVLSGEVTIENIPDAIARYLRAARKFMPDQPRHVSLDAPVGHSDERSRYEITRAA